MGPANFWARLVDGVAISRASSTIFATLGTALVSLLVIPVLEIVYSLLFGADLHSTQLLRTAYVASCVSFTSAICSGMVSRVATDRHLGVFQEVHSWRRFDAAYWLAAALVPVIFATTTAVIASVLAGKPESSLMLLALSNGAEMLMHVDRLCSYG